MTNGVASVFGVIMLCIAVNCGCQSRSASLEDSLDDVDSQETEVTAVELADPDSVTTTVSSDSSAGDKDVNDKDVNDIEKIDFADLNLGMESDQVFRPFMLTERARELDGQVVRISGYMDAGVLQQEGFRDFVLLRNTECKFGPGGQADHLVHVEVEEDINTKYTDKVISATGLLSIEPFQGDDGNTWAIYKLQATAVTAFRR